MHFVRQTILSALLVAALPATAFSSISTASGLAAPQGDPDVSFSISSATTVEASTVVAVQVVLSAVHTSDVTIPYTVTGSADSGDATVPVGPLVVPVGQTGGMIDIQVHDDVLSEGRERLILTLGTPTNGTLGAITVFELVIDDDEPAATLAFDAATSMAAEGAGTVLITVTLSAARTEASSVTFGLGGSATAGGVDVTVSPVSPLVVLPGATTAALSAVLVSDAIHENDEDLVVTMLVPDNCALGGTTQHALTIIDDDPLPLVEFTMFRTVVYEINGGFDLRFQLNAASGLDVSVPFTATGSASGPGDVTLPPSPAVIPAGETFIDLPVTLVVDRIPELAERILFTLGAPTGAGLGLTSSQLVLIADGIAGPVLVAPPLTPSVTSLVFPTTRVGEGTTPQSLFFTNFHSAPVVLENVAAVGAMVDDFDLTFPVPLPITLAPAQSAQVDVTFTPLGRGARSLVFRAEQQGQGAPPISVSVSGLAFGVPGEEILMNAALEPFDAPGSEDWSAEYGASGGALASSSVPVLGTSLEGLYQTYRLGGALDYALELPNGTYEVIIHTWEPVQVAPGQRVFDVLMEGVVVLDDLDIFVEVGERTAYASAPRRVILIDGVLDIGFQSSVSNALVSAIEVRSIPVLSTSTTTLAFGPVDPGNSLTANMVVQNTGLFAGTIDRVTFLAAAAGSSEDFKVTDGAMEYVGGSSTVSHNTAIVVGPGTTNIAVTFAPTAHANHVFQIEFESTTTGDTFTVDVSGLGSAQAGWGYLHPVIDSSPSLVVDYNASGDELVELSGAGSHTYEPGQVIAGYDWRVAGVSVANTADTSYMFSVGSTPLSLTIADSNAPPSTAMLNQTMVVHPVDRVPGPLALYYDGSLLGATFLLNNLPATYNFAERLSMLEIVEQDGRVGGSGFFGDVMVRWIARFDLAAPRTLEFVATGGVARTVFVDGAPASAPALLAAGSHALELRYAVDDLGDLPLTLQILEGGVPATDIENALVHDEQLIPPVIHAMPTIGPEIGGTLVEIDGFGFFPESQTSVDWGGTIIPSASFVDWGGERIVITLPPGTGSVQVRVQTPKGNSDPIQFDYTPSGSTPVRFDLLTAAEINISNVTCAEWGPDGRLYVGVLDGTLRIITYNDDYTVASIGFAAGVSGVTNNFHTLSVAFNPWDDYDPQDPTSLKLYIAHGWIYQNGGWTPTGPSIFPGEISILTGPNFDAPVPLVTGLPVSNHDHSIMGIEFDDNGDLLLNVGGNTNAGVRWPLSGDLPESPLSGSTVKFLLSKPGFNGTIQYVHSVTGAIVADQRLGEEIDVMAGVDIEVYVDGMRNAYDLCLHTNGYLYATDNGPNNPYGPESLSATTQGGLPHPTTPDEIILVEEGNYYGAANRSRGRYDDRENKFRWTSEPSIANVYTAPIALVNSSTNGLDEYRATAFNSAMRGELIAMWWNFGIYRIELSSDGRRVTRTTPYSSPDPDFEPNRGLDVVTGPGGAIIALDYSGNRIRTQVPVDLGATGVTPYDITPWRVPATGGQQFVIGGLNFGTNQAIVSVTIGGMSAVVTSVSDTRIRGSVPPSVTGDETDLLDVVVQVGLIVRTIPEAFRYLPPTPGLKRGTWRGAADLPQGLGDVASAVVDGELFLFGAGDSRTFTFDLLQDNWSLSSAQRSFNGGGHAAEVVDGKVYLFGGFNGAAAGRVQIYDPVLDQWSLGAPMPWSAGGCVTATIDGIIYVGGGVAPGGGTVGNFSSYDPVMDSWASLGTLPTAVHMAAAGTDGQRLFVFGGRQGMLAAQSGIDEIQIYDPLANTWQTTAGGQLGAMPLPRSSTGRAIFWDGEFHVMGGADASTTFDEVQAYDPVAGTWRVERDMLTARQAISPAIFQSRIFVHGGADVVGFGALRTTEVFSPR